MKLLYYLYKQSLESTISCFKQWINPDKTKNLEISGTVIYSAIDSIVDRIVFLNEYDKKDEYIKELVEMISSYLLYLSIIILFQKLKLLTNSNISLGVC